MKSICNAISQRSTSTLLHFTIASADSVVKKTQLRSLLRHRRPVLSGLTDVDQCLVSMASGMNFHSQ